MDLVVMIYSQSRAFPKEEMYGLTNQMRRAAVSIPSNIAEGQGRSTTKEFLHMLYVARGSLMELQTQSEIASRLDYLKPDAAEKIVQLSGSVGRLLNALINALKRKL
jgi:four helix bundle protein